MVKPWLFGQTLNFWSNLDQKPLRSGSSERLDVADSSIEVHGFSGRGTVDATAGPVMGDSGSGLVIVLRGELPRAGVLAMAG